MIISALITNQPGSISSALWPCGRSAEMRGDYCASIHQMLAGQAHEHFAHQSRYFQSDMAAHHGCGRYEPRTNVRLGKLRLANTPPKTRSPNHRLRRAQSPTGAAANAMLIRATDRTCHQ